MLMRSRAPPVNILNMPAMVPWFWPMICSNCSGLMPGTGIWVPMRYTNKANSRNSRRDFSSPRPAPMLWGSIVGRFAMSVTRIACVVAAIA